ncbi:HxsD-like protein [Candidatus Woesearchaeota archaeon]|nr:HxsD-like protein [Candidatus Woesearchaeota archaeon]
MKNKTIRLNSRLYDVYAIRNATSLFKENCDAEIELDGPWLEVTLTPKEPCDADVLAREFSNACLFFMKQR